MKLPIGFWIPFGFTTLLCAVVMIGRFAGGPETGMPAFYCFLPMSFFFLAAALIESSKRVHELEQRVKVLEGKP